jgi:hypothetical protein
MAEHPPPIQFEDVPLDEARRMGRGPRMDPELYQQLRERIQSLGNTASRMTIPEGTSPTTMKNRITRVAAERGIPVTIRRVLGDSSSGAPLMRTSNKPKRWHNAYSEHSTSAKPHAAADAGGAHARAEDDEALRLNWR